MDFLFYPGSVYNHVALLLFPLSIKVLLTLIDIRGRLSFLKVKKKVKKKKKKKRCVVGTEIMVVEALLAAFYSSADSEHNGALAACFWLAWIHNKQLSCVFIFKTDSILQRQLLPTCEYLLVAGKLQK